MGSLSHARIFHNREIRIPELPKLEDGLDELACGEAINKGKLSQKERNNSKTERLDTLPFKLAVGLRVLMRDTVSKKWSIPGYVVSIRPGGRSAYVKTDNNNRVYLRNRRLLRIFEFWVLVVFRDHF